MLSPRLTNCKECANIPDLLRKIDCKLAELGNNLYNNVVFMLNRPIAVSQISELLVYKRVLTFRYCDTHYASGCPEVSTEDIASKVIRLTAGCVSLCNEIITEAQDEAKDGAETILAKLPTPTPVF